MFEGKNEKSRTKNEKKCFIEIIEKKHIKRFYNCAQY